MKKLLAVVLAAVMMLSLCSCAFGKAVTAYSLYSKAVKTIEEAGGFETDCKITMSVAMFGESLDIPVNVNIKKNGEDYQLSTDMGTGAIKTTYAGGYVYVDYDSENGVRYSLATESEAANELNAELNAYSIPKLTEELLEAVEVVKNEDGTKAISVSLTAEQAQSMFGAAGIYEDFVFESIVLEMHFTENNELSTMDIAVDGQMIILGSELPGSIKCEYTFINFGTAPEISLALSPDQYEDGGEYEAE